MILLLAAGRRRWGQGDHFTMCRVPGDPTPYLLYPPELSLTGALAQTVAVVGIVLMLP